MSVRLCSANVPFEVLENIAFALVALTPVGNPSALLPLLLTSRAIYNALSMHSGSTLYSRICRLKFDVDAVTRRAFSPHTRDLNDHLVQMCQLLQVIRRGDIWHVDAEDCLIPVFVAMLDNDGRNRTQLEQAGIEAFLDRFIDERLHEGKERNDMWPIEEPNTACALWLLWMFTTREKLQAETQARRANIVRLILPYVMCPYRYASAYAPANHFTLPLGETNPVQKQIITFPTVHGPYPIYHTERQGILVLHHFRSSQPVLLPPISAAAKLLYWCRHEITPFFTVPSHPPLDHAAAALVQNPGNAHPDPTRFLRLSVARLPENVQWDWDAGGPVTSTQMGSKTWDLDWWRMRLCRSVFDQQPRWRLGHVYLRGMLSGVWQGVYFLVNEASQLDLLRRSTCPADSSAAAMSLMPQPLTMTLQEHGFIRAPSIPTHDTRIGPRPCGNQSASEAIPCANPHIVQAHTNVDGIGRRIEVPVDHSSPNAWLPGPFGGLRWSRGPEMDAGIQEDLRSQGNRLSASGHSKRSMSTVRFVVESNHDISGPSSHQYTYETYHPDKQAVHDRMVEAHRALKDFPMQSNSSDAPTFVPHPGCPRCFEREEYLSARRDRDSLRRRHLAEDAFSRIGMGMDHRSADDRWSPESESDDDEGSAEKEVLDLHLDINAECGDPANATQIPTFSRHEEDELSQSPLESDREDEDDDDSDEDSECGHPGVRDPSGEMGYEPVRRSHDRYRVEECDSGVEDTIITGELDGTYNPGSGQRHSVYYGRVRPWDGLIAILKQEIFGERIASFLFYGYIYGNGNFVGNWKYAAVDPLMPGYENCFIMSKLQQ